MSLLQGLARGQLVCMLLLTSACSIYSLPGSQPTPEEGEPDYTVVRPAPGSTPEPTGPGRSSTPQETSSAAYQPLLDRAGQARQRGDYEQALALLDRAQRIDPDSPDIYLAMAQTHSARGDKAQARATAERGLLYCSSQQQCNALRRYTR